MKKKSSYGVTPGDMKRGYSRTEGKVKGKKKLDEGHLNVTENAKHKRPKPQTGDGGFLGRPKGGE
jgi:hypothetical protein